MMITDEHMEWATVHRMRDMLVNVHDDYKVTHTYALFTAILCWVMQRIRTNGIGRIDRRAQSVLETLKNEFISDQPWGIWTIGANDQQMAQDIPRHGPFLEFDEFTAARFLTALRNATAHADPWREGPDRASIASNSRSFAVMVPHALCATFRSGNFWRLPTSYPTRKMDQTILGTVSSCAGTTTSPSTVDCSPSIRRASNSIFGVMARIRGCLVSPETT